MVDEKQVSKEPLPVEVENLTVEFHRRVGFKRIVKTAVDDASLVLKAGETLALVGESGSGKSSLVRTLFGLNPIKSGKVRVLGIDIQNMTAQERRKVRGSMQMVFQDPYSSLNPSKTAHDIVAEPLQINKAYSKERVHELFEQVGLSRALIEKKPPEFSGGQRQRIGIARALALEPGVVVLDEPVSALDLSVQAQVLNLLDDLQQELGLSYLFIAHDLAVIRHIADRVAVMETGRIIEQGTRDEVFNSPTEEFTRTLLNAIPISSPYERRARGEAVGAK